MKKSIFLERDELFDSFLSNDHSPQIKMILINWSTTPHRVGNLGDWFLELGFFLLKVGTIKMILQC